MGNGYFISVYRETSWQVQPEIFFKMLRTTWPFIEMVSIPHPDDAYLLEWSIYIGGNELHGLLAKTLQGIVITRGSLERSAEFAVWVQELYPKYKRVAIL